MKKKKKLFAIFITLIILFFITFDATMLDWVFNGQPYPLYPKSPENIQLYSRTVGLGFPSFSRVYIKYSIFNTKYSGVTFTEDEGPCLCSDNADYYIEWIDDTHVSISFKGNDDLDYWTEIIEY